MDKVKLRIKRVLAGVAAVALAAVCMAALPARAMAAEGVHSIFSIDAGRKYFSADQLKQIIDRAAKNGYTDVQLILANDGMRFFLDDMSVSANGQSYESDAVKAALTAGNNSYYKDPNGNALTEAEMDDIVAHAESRGIGIVPVINSPGHMDALLVAMKELGIQNAAYTNGSKVSKRTVDITNDEAVNFLYAVLQKYISYFGEKGVSEYFNFGADEFANDVFTNPGWGEIQRNGAYKNFVDYANHVSGLIKSAGMKPVCFNDGIYYNRNTSFGTFDQDLTVSYWTSGWWGFYVAKPEFLQQQGLDILNTNDAWYWVLGNIDSGGYHFNNAVKNIASKGFNEVTGASGTIPTIGSMQCVWCDEPSKPHDMDRIFELMDKFSAKHEQYMPKPVEPPRAIFSIDAGRKYFSAGQLMQIIDRAYMNGYTDVQLILANDGMRFFLDDMSIQANGKSYESDAVKAALTAGNNSYYEDPNGNALTQTEMDAIVAHAKSRGIGIVPVINSPGHMDALLVAMKELGIQNAAYTNGSKTSVRTVDITNDEAVNFLYAVLQKYISYFGKAGVSDYFNFGADEFANDVFTNPGWGEIQRNGAYKNFVDYANHVAGLIKAAGMKPVCFNDGIYYNRNTSHGTFDPDLVISYWTSGWWGFNVAKPEFLQGKGHEILNTNDGWYWVLGRIDSGGYHFNNAMKNIEAKRFNEVTGASGDVPTIGSMQCVWCDEPSKPHDMGRIFQLMDKYGTKHDQYMPKPANYAAVDAALATVPEDLSIYTDETAQAVRKAVAAVKRGYKADKQAAVDKMAANITAAVEALVERPADYAAVDAALARVPEDLSVYTAETVKAVEDAVAAVKRDLTISKQEQVNKMAADINAAVDALALRDADYTAVDAALATVPKDMSNYTSETVKAVEDAVAAVKRGYKIDKQAEVDKMAADIEAAVKALALRDADYSKVDAALATVPKDLSIYTSKTAKAVEDAVAAVKRGYKIDKQAEVDKMAADITAAVKALVERPADYAAVDAALATVPEDLSVYTPETAKAVKDAVAAVKRDLTISKQAEVDKMAADIEAAVKALELRDADYSKVDAALAAVPKDLSGYTDASVKAVKDAVAAVKRGYKIDKQAEVDKMAADIEAAVKALAKKPADKPVVNPGNKPGNGSSSGLPTTGDPAQLIGLMAAGMGVAGAGLGIGLRRRKNAA